MASAAAPYRSKRSLSDTRHLMRWLKHHAGMEIAAIAKGERVSAETVRQSIHQIEIYRAKSTTTEMDLALRDLVISAVPQAKMTLDGLLAATELVEKKNAKTGTVKVVTVADKTTRLEALRVLNSIAQTMQPKAPTFQNNVSATAQAAATTVTAAETSEERFRRLRAQINAHNALPPEVAGVPEYIDKGGDAADEDLDDEEDDDKDGESGEE